MDMMNLTILPSRGAKLDFGGRPPSRAEFRSDRAGAKGLAPPGSAPPPKPKEKALGEEGATREPIAPTQDLDFSPKIDPKNRKIDSEEFALDLEDAVPAELPEGAQAPNVLSRDYAQGLTLAAVATLGPIVVPAKPETKPSPNPADEAAGDSRTVPVQFGKQEFELEQTESKNPPRLAADVCQASNHPRGEDKGIGSEEPRLRPPVSNSEQTAQKPDRAPENGLFSRREHMEKLAGANGPVVEAIQEEPVPSVSPANLDSNREAALKLKAHDQHAADSKPEVKAGGAEAKVKLEREPDVKLEIVKDESLATKLSAQGSRDTGDSLLKRRGSRVSSDGASLTFERTDSKSGVMAPVPVQADSSQRAASETKVKETAVPELGTAQRESVIRQVVDRVESLAAASPRRNVTIHLDPREFGSITLIVKRNGSEVDTEIYASHEAVRHALENNKTGLQSGLEQRGVHLASMTVGTEVPNGSGRQEQAAKEAAQTSNFTPRSERNEAPTLTLDAMRNMTRRATGVDLWI